jgi:hypothetical protein
MPRLVARSPDSLTAGHDAERGALVQDVSRRAPYREHPEPDLLVRFLRGDLPRPEGLRVIRHLLTGCAKCLEVTRPVWALADRPRNMQLDPEDAEDTPGAPVQPERGDS